MKCSLLLIYGGLTRYIVGAQYVEPAWWPLVAATFDGVRLRRCIKRDGVTKPLGPPPSGQRCARRPKTCFFGNQNCNGVLYPETRCVCDDMWQCQPEPCPSTTTPPPSPDVSTMPPTPSPAPVTTPPVSIPPATPSPAPVTTPPVSIPPSTTPSPTAPPVSFPPSISQSPSMPPSKESSICFIVYQNADVSNIEPSIRQDVEELTVAPITTNPATTTWIYHDARNFGSTRPVSGTPFQNVYTSDGMKLLSVANFNKKEEWSSYLTYDHNFGKMIQERVLGNEADSDDPNIVTSFLEVALTDCVEKKSTEFIMIFSSHGGGYYGFGGDDNKNRRRLGITNGNLKGAIQAALSAVDGAPSKLDVLGFDACLMQGFGAIDDYHSITKYYLGSEATEPGHGWAYDELDDTSSALGLSQQIVATFTSSLHGFPDHKVPKTLAVVETSKYPSFLTAVEALFSFLRVKVEGSPTNSDPNLWTHLSRSHRAAIKFQGIIDGESGPQSALDIGSFLFVLRVKCKPVAAFATLIDSALTAYNAQFVDRKIGPKTPKGTGMAIFWPSRRYYRRRKDIADFFLFDDQRYVTAVAPNYQDFLKVFLRGKAPAAPLGDSVCQAGLDIPSFPGPDQEGGMLRGAKLDKNTADEVCMTTEATSRTDIVVTEFAINIALESSGETRRRLDAIIQRRRQVLPKKEPRRRMVLHQDTPITNSYQHRISSHGTYSMNQLEITRRRTEEDINEDYLILFGGEMPGSDTGSIFSACWDRKFYVLEDTITNNTDVVYILDRGEGGRSFPLVFFPDSTSQSVLNTTFFDVDNAYAQGGLPAFGSFVVDEDTGQPLDNLVVFARHATGSFVEIPRTGGWIIPINFVEAVIDGTTINEVVGGLFDTTVLAWDSNSTDIRIKSVNEANYLNMFETSDDPAGPLLIGVTAYDLDVADDDAELLNVEFVPLAI